MYRGLGGGGGGDYRSQASYSDDFNELGPVSGRHTERSDFFTPSLQLQSHWHVASLPQIQSRESRRYGPIGHGVPTQPGYLMRSRSLNVLPTVPDERFGQFQVEDQPRRYDDRSHGVSYRPTSNMRSSSSNGNIPGAGDLFQRAPAPSSPHLEELLAKIESMSLQQAELNERNEFLSRRTQELESIVAAGGSVRPSSFSERSGGVASRGKIHQHKRQVSQSRARVLIRPPEEELHHSESGSEPSDSEPKKAAYLGVPVKDIDPRFKGARAALQSVVSRTFRAVVGVSGNNWPDLTVERFNEITNESYMNPAFDEMVSHPTNFKLCEQVATQVAHELSGRPDYWPSGLNIPGFNVKWDKKALTEMAKTSFRSCKQQYRVQMDETVAQRNAANRRTNRRRDHRVTKAEQRGKQVAIAAFATKHNLDPNIVKELIHEQFMSDEASGPEDDDDKGIWKTRMAFKAGYGDLSAEELAKIDFLEVLGCPWRADELSGALQELSAIAFGFLTQNEKKKIQYIRVRDTGRASSRIPEIAPYNFGINPAWLEANKEKPEYVHLLVDWGTYKDPEGFGTNKRVIEENVVEGDPDLDDGDEA
ncbi:hypothetical protein DFH07DRAFT_960848 [Mycena maculata]|uniref:Uncharacterized protein n=1 Tax=Mycena maculata TaxID=230809 RepID=A0AAD7N8Y1_9AGAR|nr:hypothetical protein DFH07DRAFT_960848 [Mycena maculata]